MNQAPGPCSSASRPVPSIPARATDATQKTTGTTLATCIKTRRIDQRKQCTRDLLNAPHPHTLTQQPEAITQRSILRNAGRCVTQRTDSYHRLQSQGDQCLPHGGPRHTTPSEWLPQHTGYLAWRNQHDFTRQHARCCVLAANHAAGKQVVIPAAIAQSVQVDPAFAVTGEGHGTALVRQRLEPNLECGGLLQRTVRHDDYFRPSAAAGCGDVNAERRICSGLVITSIGHRPADARRSWPALVHLISHSKHNIMLHNLPCRSRPSTLIARLAQEIVR